MFKLAFVYLLLIHILGDYYFQTEKLAEDKNTSIGSQLIHGLIYTAVSFVCILPIMSCQILIAILLLSASHLTIDLMKYTYIQIRHTDACSLVNQRFIYLVDQAMHITCILIASYIITANNIDISIPSSLLSIFITAGIDPETVLTWVTLFLLIWKPANITIKQLLYLYKPAENPVVHGPGSAEASADALSCNGKIKEMEIKEVEESSKNTGGFIGFLERLIILIFLSINQYSAIGLVLTAKSIARYNKISENKEFAEYYLLGTLLSTVIVIGSYLLIA